MKPKANGMMSGLKSTALHVVWRIVSGPALLVVISQQLSPTYQGYWFAFVSFAALCVFADLGFTTVVLQFSANRFSKLKFSRLGYLCGKSSAIDDSAALFSFSFKWIASLSAAVFPIIWAVGFYFLSQKEVVVNWRAPWILYSAGSLFFLIANVVLSFLEGCDSVAKVQKYKMLTSMVSVGVTLGALLLGFNLYALVLGVFASCLAAFGLIWSGFRRPLAQLLRRKSCLPSVESKRIRHILGRYAISFASGYFVFQAFTPIAFHYYGPIEAGQVGLSLAIWMAILNVSNVWLVSVTPKFNIFAANGQFVELFGLFKRNIWRSVVTYILGASVFVGLLVEFKSVFAIGDRLLDVPAQLQLAFIFLSQVLIAGMATYVRAFLKEPFALMSLVSAVFINVCSIYIGLNYSIDYLFAGMLLSCVVSVPLTYRYYLQARAST